MAKKKDSAPGKLRGQAREQLAELGYEKLLRTLAFDPFGESSMDATADLWRWMVTKSVSLCGCRSRRCRPSFHSG